MIDHPRYAERSIFERERVADRNQQFTDRAAALGAERARREAAAEEQQRKLEEFRLFEARADPKRVFKTTATTEALTDDEITLIRAKV